MSKILNKIDKQNLDENKYCIVSEYFNQYALGVTGVTIINKILLNTDKQGFATKTEALNKMKELGLQLNKTIKGAKNEGYGSVGSVVHKCRVYTIKHAMKKYSEYNCETINV